jgi:hypothetical protein
MTDKKKNTHGGANRGQGRKPSGDEPKKAIGTKVNRECRDNLQSLADASGHSKAAIVEWAFNCKIKEVPKTLK